MRTYLALIQMLQHLLVRGSVLYLMTVPILLGLFPERVPTKFTEHAFFISLAFVTFVMAIRPLADLMPKVRWVRMLVILRKGFGIASASIIVSFILAKMLDDSLVTYVGQWFDASYWSLSEYALLAHLGDVTAIILLVTSNNFSMRMLTSWWKYIQKLAYVYFYSGALYESLAFQNMFATVSVLVVTVLVCAAFIYNRKNAFARRRA